LEIDRGQEYYINSTQPVGERLKDGLLWARKVCVSSCISCWYLRRHLDISFPGVVLPNPLTTNALICRDNKTFRPKKNTPVGSKVCLLPASLPELACHPTGSRDGIGGK